MGLVVNIKWDCPCGSEEVAQVGGDWEDPNTFPINAVPSNKHMHYNPACKVCGEYELSEPAPVLVTYVVRKVK